ncbi:MAG: DUF2189 domain-containing protein [Gallionellaceae bacterium]|nr:DUF2189 domain-containing protein [Gallionellaceae bacterium]
MTTSTVCNLGRYVPIPCLNRVEPLRPLRWLRAGWGDSIRTWRASFGYGLILATASYLVAATWSRPALAPTLTVLLLLLGPFLAIAFYDLSARLERGRAAGRRLPAFARARHNLASIGLFGVLLAFGASLGERLSAILIGLRVGAGPVPDAGLAGLFSLAQPGFLLMYGGLIVILGLAVFSLSVVTLPMLMGRRVDIVTALMTSLWSVRENPAALLLWAAAITAITTLGVLTWYAGLAIGFPVLGHATWHAYRDLVAR